MFDDIIIPTAGTLDEHLHDVGMVMDRLIQAGFAVRCDKVHIAMKQVPYLGFLVGEGGTQPLEEKTKAILEMAYEDMRCKGGAAAARYAGMIGFYHRFIPNLHTVLAPFHECKGKDAPVAEIIDSLQFRAAFEYSKYALSNVTALARPDFSKPFYVDVDTASTTGIGCVLSQRDDVDDPDSHRPLAFWSRRLANEEKRYGVRDQECLGLSDALQNWRHLILGARIILRTDHHSLQWLLSTVHKPGTRVSGWALKAQGFDLEIQYVPGVKHVVADTLSRHPVHSSVLTESTRRAPIEDRVDEALDVAAEFRADPARLAAAAHLSGLFAGEEKGATAESNAASATARSAGESSTGSTGIAFTETGSNSILFGILDAVGCLMAADVSETAPTEAAVAEARATPLEADKPARCSTAKSAAVVFLRRAKQGLEVLVEAQGTISDLPSVAITPHGTYRQQLSKRLLYTQGTELSVLLLGRGTKACKRRTVEGSSTHFFVGDASAVQLASVQDAAYQLHFVPVDEHFLQSLTLSPDNASFMRLILRHAQGGKMHQGWRMQQAWHVVQGILSSQECSANAATAERLVPTPDTCPYGPALCLTEEHFKMTGALMLARLRKHPHLSIAVDLEGDRLGEYGKTCYVQASVDAVEPEEAPLTYVFDTLALHRCFRGPSDFREILEDANIAKVFHCCYGDASALYHEFSITLRGVFDTSIADCLALSRHPGKPRGLGTVIKEWLGDENVQLNQKGKVEHVPGLWLIRPLTWRLFEYAYEDVTYCNVLYAAQRAQLERLGLVQLTFALSLQRAPPRALPSRFSQQLTPSNILIALSDDSERVLCLRNGDGTLSLPSIPYPSTPAGVHQLRNMAAKGWAEVVGPPKKPVKAAVSCKLHKGVRVADSLLFTATVPNLVECLSDLGAAFSPSAELTALCTRALYSPGSPDGGCRADQQVIFQHLHSECARKGRVDAALVDVFSATTEASLRVGAPLAVRPNGYVSLSLHLHVGCVGVGTAVADAAAPLGKPSPPTRAAIILLDGSQVYTLVDAKGHVAFPSSVLEDGVSPFDSASKMFDVYAGVALRKQATPTSLGEDLLLMPRTSASVNRAFKESTALGAFGNTLYFACVMQQGEMAQYRSSFHAARGARAGFELTPQALKKHPSFSVRSWADVVAQGARIQMSDLAALQSAIDCVGAQVEGPAIEYSACGVADLAALRSLVDGDGSQSGSSGNSAGSLNSLAQAARDAAALSGIAIPALRSEAPTRSSSPLPPSQHSGTSSMAARVEVDAPDEEESLFLSAVAVNLARVVRELSSVVDAAPSEPVARVAAPTNEAIAEEQRNHPATRRFVDYLTLRELSVAWQDANEGVRAQLVQVTKGMYIRKDGVLVMSPVKSSDPDRIVLPPKFHATVMALYHDQNGHLGLKKVSELISTRFVWGARDEMRNACAEHIRLCEPCARAKRGSCRAGEYQVDGPGNQPGDIWSGDVFEVGCIAPSGHSHTIDFACHFSKRIISQANVGSGTSEDIANVLRDQLIRHYGRPSEIRSDRGTNFISAAIRELYRKLKIRIVDGTAYHHQIVAIVERWHRTLKQMLLTQKASKLGTDWPSRLPLLELAYNTTVNESTGYSPFYIDHIRHAVLPYDVMTSGPEEGAKGVEDWVQDQLNSWGVVYDAVTTSLRTRALHAKKRYDLRRDVAQSFRPGARVLLVEGTVVDGVHPKMDLPTRGPYTVQARLPRDRYVLTDLGSRRIHNVVHVSRLVRFPDQPAAAATWMLAEHAGGGPGGGQWPVKAIVGKKRMMDKKSNAEVTHYLVRWVGFDRSYDQWRTRDELDSVADLVDLFDPPTADPLAVVPRATDAPQPPVAAEALARRRFVHRPDGSQAPLGGDAPEVPLGVPSGDVALPTTEVPVARGAELEGESATMAGPTGSPAATPAENDLTDRFPVGSRVRVYYPAEKRSWTGSVIRSRVTKPRTVGKAADRLIDVLYDDPKWQDAVVTHGLSGSVVKLLTPAAATITAHVHQGKVRRSARLVRECALAARGVTSCFAAISSTASTGTDTWNTLDRLAPGGVAA